MVAVSFWISGAPSRTLWIRSNHLSSLNLAAQRRANVRLEVYICLQRHKTGKNTILGAPIWDARPWKHLKISE